MPESNDSNTLALLSAFLDGELGAAEERDLLSRLEQEPALQDALDSLAEQMALTHRAIAAAFDGPIDADLMAGVVAAMDADAVPASAFAADVLANLLVDGEASDAQAARLDTIINGDASDAIDAASDALAFVDATRAVVGADVAAAAPGLGRLPDFVQARVERTERGYALAAAAADGALSATEVDELAGLVGADVDLLGIVEQAVAARVHVAGADRAFSEALDAITTSPAMARLAARAGSAALQVIGATQALSTQHAAQQQAEAARSATTTTVSFWRRIRVVFAQGFVPLAAASAAAVAFVAIGGGEPQVATGGTDRLAEVRRAFMDVLGPVVLAQNTTLASAEPMPVLGDNDADVEAIDATGTTMVFQTAESNITVIWVAGLDEDGPDSGEQGT